MNIYHKCKADSIFQEVAFQGSSPAVTTVTRELVPQGSNACLRMFSAWSGYCDWENISFDGADTDKIASLNFRKKDAGSTSLLDLFIPIHPNQFLFNGTGGASGVGSLFNIPGPGIFSDDGLEVVVSIPPNIGNGADQGPIMACVNVVYSV
jgi:hypothetical protein|tara:strand:+ start:541 stop:993 length:453 start_codon:yes stop_codon:yes gene_type:complete